MRWVALLVVVVAGALAVIFGAFPASAPQRTPTPPPTATTVTITTTATTGKVILPASPHETSCTYVSSDVEITFLSDYLDVGPLCHEWVITGARAGVYWAPADPNAYSGAPLECNLTSGRAIANVYYVGPAGGLTTATDSACADLVANGWQQP